MGVIIENWKKVGESLGIGERDSLQLLDFFYFGVGGGFGGVGSGKEGGGLGGWAEGGNCERAGEGYGVILDGQCYPCIADECSYYHNEATRKWKWK